MKPKEDHLTIRIEKSQVAELQRVAKKRDRSVSYLIRQAIEEFLKKERTNANKD